MEEHLDCIRHCGGSEEAAHPRPERQQRLQVEDGRWNIQCIEVVEVEAECSQLVM